MLSAILGINISALSASIITASRIYERIKKEKVEWERKVEERA